MRVGFFLIKYPTERSDGDATGAKRNALNDDESKDYAWQCCAMFLVSNTVSPNGYQVSICQFIHCMG
jgi:hypothetical protein